MPPNWCTTPSNGLKAKALAKRISFRLHSETRGSQELRVFSFRRSTEGLVITFSTNKTGCTRIVRFVASIYDLDMKIKTLQLIVCASAGAIFQTQPVALANNETGVSRHHYDNDHNAAGRIHNHGKAEVCKDRTPRQGQGVDDLTNLKASFHHDVTHTDSHSGHSYTAGSVEKPMRNEWKDNSNYQNQNSDAVTARPSTEAKPMAREQQRQEKQLARDESELNRNKTDWSSPKTVSAANDHNFTDGGISADAVQGVTPDRTPRQGLGGEDLTRGSYASSSSIINDPAGSNNARFNYRNSPRKDMNRSWNQDGNMKRDQQRDYQFNGSKSDANLNSPREKTTDKNVNP